MAVLVLVAQLRVPDPVLVVAVPIALLHLASSWCCRESRSHSLSLFEKKKRKNLNVPGAQETGASRARCCRCCYCCHCHCPLVLLLLPLLSLLLSLSSLWSVLLLLLLLLSHGRVAHMILLVRIYIFRNVDES